MRVHVLTLACVITSSEYNGLFFLLLWDALFKPARPSSYEILSQESKDKLKEHLTAVILMSS